MARLITKTGQRAEMACDMSNERSGKLICDPSMLALADLQGDLMLETDDGGGAISGSRRSARTT